MNRYWDLTEQQRAALTGEQVRAFLDVELMERGVAKVAQPMLQETQDIVLPKSPYYEIHRKGDYSDQATGLLFTTAEAAADFIKLSPLWRESNWQYGNGNEFAQPGRELGMKSIELPSEADTSNQAVILKQNKAAEEANNEAKTAYSEAIQKVEKATSGVWDDWNECRECAAKYRKVIDTRTEYLKLCEQNATMAESFLQKAFAAEFIAKANEWYGVE
jgi:hypothetical protein